MLVFIIPFRNCENYLQECLLSLIHQSDKEWRALIVDDYSTDNSVEKIPKDRRITLIQNKNRMSALPNIHNAITSDYLDDEDIVCILDGDDKLTTADACKIIMYIYKTYDPLITYGQYITSEGMIGHCRPYTSRTFEYLRNNHFWASHLKTFKWRLYKQLITQDPELLCYKNDAGKMYEVACDVAIMTPLLEIAGFRRTFFNPYPIYFYRIHPQNDHQVNFNLQIATAAEIYTKRKFVQVF